MIWSYLNAEHACAKPVVYARDLELHIVTHTRAILIGIVEGILSGFIKIFV